MACRLLEFRVGTRGEGLCCSEVGVIPPLRIWTVLRVERDSIPTVHEYGTMIRMLFLQREIE